jgi:hypothetical protein
VELPGSSISQEVWPEDKMAADSQNGDIIVLSGRVISSMLLRQGMLPPLRS